MGIQTDFMLAPLCKAQLAYIRLKVFSTGNIDGQLRFHKGMQLALELLLRSRQLGWVLAAPGIERKHDQQSAQGIQLTQSLLDLMGCRLHCL